MYNFEYYAFLLLIGGVAFTAFIVVYVTAKFLTKVQKIIAFCSAAIIVVGGGVGCFTANFTLGSNRNYDLINSYDYTVFNRNSDYSYDGDTGVYTVTSNSETFKILQLTDVHICASCNSHTIDEHAFDACYKLIKKAQPDLIIVTGDIAYTMNIETFCLNNLNPMKQFLTFMDKVGLPWALEYGNHDTDDNALYSANDINNLIKEFKAQHSPILYADKTPNIYGRYNQYIIAQNKSKTTKRALFLIDSNDYIKGGSDPTNSDYDSVHPDQITWYEKTADELSAEGLRSFIYMHIPFQDFDNAINAVNQKDQSAKYLFGEVGEKVCYPKYESGFFDKIIAKANTDAVFVGHDHLNTVGINYKGIDLVYGKSVDFAAYPGIQRHKSQRGATLVTLSNSTYDIAQINLYD